MTENQEVKKLYRSNNEKIIAGVYGGIAEYFEIDPIWPRLIGILLIFFDGIGLIAYIILWILMPENPNIITDSTGKKKPKKQTVVEEKVESFSKKVKKEFNEEKKKKAKKHNISEDEVVDYYTLKKNKKNKNESSNIIIGGILIIIGTLFLLKQFFWMFISKIFWPVIIIGVGILLLLFRRR